MLRIYLDILVITNAVITMIYIKCISKITHTYVKNLRLFLGSSLGGIASIIVVMNNSGFLRSALITTAKLAIAGTIVLISFKCRSLKNAIKYMFMYFLMDIIFSGICLIIWETTESSIIFVKNYTVYFNISLLHMIAAVILIYAFISVYEWILRCKMNAAESYKAVYTIGDYEVEIPAIADSGNKLCDTFTGTPVVIFCCSELYEHFNLDNEKLYLQSGFRLTPYTTIKEKSVIPITSKGNVKIIDSRNNIKSIKCCVGITRSDDRKAQAIFNPYILI